MQNFMKDMNSKIQDCVNKFKSTDQVKLQKGSNVGEGGELSGDQRKFLNEMEDFKKNVG